MANKLIGREKECIELKEIFLLKLGEIVLKGANRFQFENRLKTNVSRRMRPFGDFKVKIFIDKTPLRIFRK